MDLPLKQVDLTNCDREPIHTPGSIQPHGVLLICDLNDNLINIASSNAAAFLGGRHNQVVGLTLSDVIGAEVAHNLRNALSRSGSSHLAGAELDVQIEGGPVVDASIHRHGERIYVELEPGAPAGKNDAKNALDMTQALVRRIGLESDVDTLARTAVKLLRAMLGYDRVMVYRFLHNGAGKVIAEAKRPELGSFLGQYFPASDIPAQARRLYLENWIRLIADVNYDPVKLIPEEANNPAIDLSHAHLRSISPIHCEYLRNMGVSASLSISIVVDGKLWGLIACHHDTPKLVPLPLRISAELFGQYFSLQIAIAERRAQYLASAEARRRLDAIITSLEPSQPADLELTSRLEDLAGLVPCNGAGLWINGEWHTFGVTPSREQAQRLLSFINETAPGAVWATDELQRVLPGETGLGTDVAGMLSIPISSSARECLFLFRSEEAHNVEWAGEPVKKIVEGPSGPRLTPRGSFNTWREDVRGRSVPWTDPEMAVAEATRNYLRDVILRFKEATVEERARADRHRRLLNDELNHRVKNIIALVKSLALQSGTSAETVTEYTAALEGRLAALAFAHDQSQGGSGGRLETLVDAEASLHRFGATHERVVTSGPPVGLDDRTFGVLALMLHEMMTNAAKYGALSNPEGRVEISWSMDDQGRCVIEWREHGGPAVTPPDRTGFGSTLIQNTITYDLGGQVHLDYHRDGLRAQFVVPSGNARLLHGEAAAGEVRSTARDARPLSGKSVLLLEDQALIAMDLEETLLKLGASSVALIPTIPAALEELVRKTPDCAVLDVNLAGETSIEIADRLINQGIPFIFATGYRDTIMIPDRFKHVPVVQKPVTASALSDKLVTALHSTAG